MSAFFKMVLLCAPSVILLGLGTWVKTYNRIWRAACLIWLAAALPVMFFMGLEEEELLLFYLVSAAAGLLFRTGGERG